MKTAEKWLNNWSDASNSEWADAELLRIVASDGEYSPKNKTKLVEVLEKHVRGLLAISEGRTRDAFELFAAASNKPWISMEYNWSIAFRDRCKSGGWPCENRKIRNENTR